MSEDPRKVVSYETKVENPAPLFDGATPDLIQPTWGDLLTTAESEFERSDNWRRILLDQLRDAPQSDVQAETLRSAIRLHAKRAAAFAALMRMIERMRDPYIAARLADLAADQARAVGDDDMIEAD